MASLKASLANKSGNNKLKDWSPYHLNLQKPIFLQFLTQQLIFDINQFSLDARSNPIISLHHNEDFTEFGKAFPASKRVGK
jgi:hypothetical protein